MGCSSAIYDWSHTADAEALARRRRRSLVDDTSAAWGWSGRTAETQGDPMSGSDRSCHCSSLGSKARAVLVAVIFCLIAMPEAALSAADEDRPLDVNVDLRSGAVVPEDYAIVFCARPVSATGEAKSPVGHAFVIWAQNDAKLRACTVHANGFFPDNDGDELKSVFREVPGTVSDSALRNKPSAGECRLVVKVTKQQWQATEKIRTEWTEKKYRLTKSDCVTFTAAVAGELKLKTPDRKLFDFPAPYVRKLAQQNWTTHQ
jgi:hypothetical protein